MKYRYHVIDPYDSDISYVHRNYKPAKRQAEHLSMISRQAVEIKREPIPYDHIHKVLVI